MLGILNLQFISDGFRQRTRLKRMITVHFQRFAFCNTHKKPLLSVRVSLCGRKLLDPFLNGHARCQQWHGQGPALGRFSFAATPIFSWPFAKGPLLARGSLCEVLSLQHYDAEQNVWCTYGVGWRTLNLMIDFSELFIDNNYRFNWSITVRVSCC